MTTENNGSIPSIPKCGIIMPISAIDDYSAEHWAEVLSILRDVITSAGFEANLVSDADDIGIIQKRIVQNVYSNEIIVCDVSAKNPNVMFELGLRLAFDKPTLIIKDDFTDYSFDTSVIEHLEYPRDLRFTKIVAFKEKLKNKIIATYETAQANPNYSTFLKSFGEYRVSQLQSREVSSEAYMLESMEEMKKELFLIRRSSMFSSRSKGRHLGCIKNHIRQFANKRKITSVDELNIHRSELINFLLAHPHIVQKYEQTGDFVNDLSIAFGDPRLLKKPTELAAANDTSTEVTKNS